MESSTVAAAARPARPGRAHPARVDNGRVDNGRADTGGERGWLTAVLRPAGPLDAAAVRALMAALSPLAALSDMVLLDLTAAGVRDPRALARALQAPATALERAGRCLVLAGAAPALTAELDRALVPVVTLPGDLGPGDLVRGDLVPVQGSSRG